jgi:hypothetical protein
MIVISQSWGGLGDNLQLSTIPEVAHALGIDVYVSNYNTYRHPDVKKLVWDCNPYVKGFVDAVGNTTYMNGHAGNIIQQWEQQLFGRVINTQPKLYYTPKKIEKLHTEVVVDFNAHSANSSEAAASIISKYPEALYVNCVAPPNADSIQSSDIFEWVDIITSAKKFVCQHSGGSVVMAAYNKACTVYRTTQDQLYMFDLHTYIQV